VSSHSRVGPQDLDGQRSSYTAGFQFFDENARTLAWYAARVWRCGQRRGARRVLSLGVGQRIVARVLAIARNEGRLDRYVIVEGSQAALDELREDAVDFSRCERTQSWFERFDTDDRFDLVEMGFVLEHVEDPGGILERFSGFLAPGGVIAVAVPNARSLHRLIGHEAGLLVDLYHLSEADHALGHRRYFDLERLRTLVGSAGLRIETEEGIFLKPITTSQLHQLNISDAVFDALFQVGSTMPAMANSLYLEATRP
jgi:SAM-dependent methyltransferase